MKRAVVFLNGELADPKLIRKHIKTTDLLVGVDGGTKLILKLELIPDLVIGDLDSLKTVPKGVALIQFPKDKDKTDSQLALEYLVKQGYKSLIVVGVLGRRIDHLMSNIMLLSQQQAEVQIIEGEEIIYFVNKFIVIKGRKDDLVSLIPLLDCHGVKTVGLKWGLRGESLQVGSSRGISNEMTGKRAQIRLKSGLLMVIQTMRQ